MKSITKGQWVKITSGPLHRRDDVRTGVTDAEREFPSGHCWRVIHPHTGANWGWVNDAHLTPTAAPEYEPKVTGAPRQAAMDMLTGGKVRA